MKEESVKTDQFEQALLKKFRACSAEGRAKIDAFADEQKKRENSRRCDELAKGVHVDIQFREGMVVYFYEGKIFVRFFNEKQLEVLWALTEAADDMP